MTLHKPVILEEQQTYNGNDCGEILASLQANSIELIGLPDEYMGEPKYLGISPDLEAGYFVGAAWLIKDNLPVVVRPKVHNVDIAEMLIQALSISSDEEAGYFSQCYKISFNEPTIETEEEQSELTPILVIHYISLLENLVKHGLKRDYVTITENLRGKVKGHLLFNAQLRQNIIPKREDCNVCRYQVYTTDIPVNRLLKKALLFADRMLQVYMHHHRQYGKLRMRINKLAAAFDGVSDDIEISRVKGLASNKLFRHYADATRVAKEILRRYDYSLSNVSTASHKTPPFWIDMSRLFEMYVLSLLKQAYGDEIEFQVQGYNCLQVADYVHNGEGLVIDAKYKQMYAGGGVNKRLVDDIREISGNARDYSIMSKFPHPEKEPECIIIYPEDNGLSSFSGPLSELAHKKPIHQFRNFYKIPVRLPSLVK